MPLWKGSEFWKKRRDSAVIQARPVMMGWMCPLGALEIFPSKRVPRIPSWIQICPGASLPSAWRHAIFALVPVPQGERSKDAPGHRTKFREELPGDGGAAKNSM